MSHEGSPKPWTSIKVRILDQKGKEKDTFEMRAGSNLWVFLRKRGLPIGAACSGVGVCGACDVRITHDKTLTESISTQSEFERQTLVRNQKTLDKRLACLCRVYSNIDVQADYW